MTRTTRTRWFIGSAFAALLLVTAAGAGIVVATNATPSTSAAEQQGYKQGVDAARRDFCNLQFDKEGSPTVDDPRTYSGLPSSVVVADDSCTSDLVTLWNNSQEHDGSDKRACIINRTYETVVAAYLCEAPTSKGY
ncbi:hypothetical protein C5E02_10955 [Rathayibacter rathayi]|uniref:Uncharacterized protein n=1 Tax=Rathayibacter rathayi TaxID=33887 RepID=A0ABD6W9D5_RATRA|nr:hypothetical protein [Rathayibacter rathayi]AZZ49691.1 hypothetical protein C1O28_11265 [Rathayibacter rathayi]MWV75357.1 hypothetical protein [Rathayibacter rathayi NCPPB 2980 = VKM Ac-1601]PPF14035.1 hypothetical protein C5C04_07985 [Rathayibacter rathayi]PPG13181.1 hypothetical protein C5C11_07590 [Rathayibacter rathayi]PPG43490.1 hypothetical protein C5C20_08555 [Rathayibacter rathayi]